MQVRSGPGQLTGPQLTHGGVGGGEDAVLLNCRKLLAWNTIEQFQQAAGGLCGGPGVSGTRVRQPHQSNQDDGRGAVHRWDVGHERRGVVRGPEHRFVLMPLEMAYRSSQQRAGRWLHPCPGRGRFQRGDQGGTAGGQQLRQRQFGEQSPDLVPLLGGGRMPDRQDRFGLGGEPFCGPQVQHDGGSGFLQGKPVTQQFSQQRVKREPIVPAGKTHDQRVLRDELFQDQLAVAVAGQLVRQPAQMRSTTLVIKRN